MHSVAYGDPDGDAPMRSSSSSDNESEAMFPSANDPPASQNDAALAQLRQAGLSPPSSQDPPHLNGTSVDMMEVIESEDFPNGEASNVQSGARRVHGEGQEADKEPGYAWSNPRAREEYARAMDSMLDKDFSIGMWFSFGWKASR